MARRINAGSSLICIAVLIIVINTHSGRETLRSMRERDRAVTTIEDTEVMTSVFLPTKKIIIRSSIYVSVRSSCAMNEYPSACLCIVYEGH